MRYLLLMALATVLVCGGCDDDSRDHDPGADYCFQGDYYITSTSDVESLEPYDCINGTLAVGGAEFNSFNLQQIIWISGNLVIYDNPNLTNLDGLSSLDGLGGKLHVISNDTLTNLDGLSGITSVGWSLDISSNPNLANLDGLSGITSVGSFLIIRGNDIITNLDGLSDLTSVGGELYIYNNDTLPGCEVCDLLDQLTTGPTSIWVYDNLDDSCTPVPANCP